MELKALKTLTTFTENIVMEIKVYQGMSILYFHYIHVQANTKFNTSVGYLKLEKY